MCRRRALAELDGLGDPALGEWHEWSGSAYHIRRRMTAAEQDRVGPAVDIRGSDEARARAAVLGRRLGLVPDGIRVAELGR
jgi:hypothetical protein